MSRPLFLLLFSFLLISTGYSQIQVNMEIKRRLHLAYEPVHAKVTITNFAGRDLPLTDQDGIPWFGFEIIRADGRTVAPRATSYALEPLIIPAGQSVTRTVNLQSLFPLSDYGIYRIRAVIHFPPQNRYFYSAVRMIEVTEGRTVWQQTIGVPEGQQGAGETRTIQLIEFRRVNAAYLYVRIRDEQRGVVYGTMSLGRLTNAGRPVYDLDASNTLHVLQPTGPKSYTYSQVGPNAEVITRETYLAVRGQPRLKRDEAGLIAVSGAVPESAAGNIELGIGSAEKRGLPKLSDRPVKIPKE